MEKIVVEIVRNPVEDIKDCRTNTEKIAIIIILYFILVYVHDLSQFAVPDTSFCTTVIYE